MKIYNLLIALHEKTKNELQKSTNAGLSKRLFVRTYEITRIGKKFDRSNRNDVSTELLLISYLARKVYINEKNLRGRFLTEEFYQKEVEFTNGLWDIFSFEVFGEYLPQLPVPETYDELQYIFDNNQHYLNFNLYNTVKEAVIHNKIHDSNICTTMREFDRFCSLPGYDVGWTLIQHSASLSDGRYEAPQRLIQTSLGMYRYDYIGCPEPYQYFWKERAMASMKKAIALLEKSYIIKFRNATMYEYTPLPVSFTPVEKFQWNIKKM